MQRYFVDKKNDDNFYLNSDDSYHFIKVMRANSGESVEIVYNKKLFLGKLIKADLKESIIKTSKEIDLNDINYNISIAQALVVEQKFNIILQKCTELGAKEIIPLEVSRSKINLDKKVDKKVERWQKIVKEASSQSKRIDIPKVKNICNIKELIAGEYDHKFLCSVNEKSKTIKMVLQNMQSCDKILFVVGPEGGFTDYEEELLMTSGFIRISLGDLVLRTETASIAILSMVNYHFMR